MICSLKNQPGQLVAVSNVQYTRIGNGLRPASPGMINIEFQQQIASPASCDNLPHSHFPLLSG